MSMISSLLVGYTYMCNILYICVFIIVCPLQNTQLITMYNITKVVYTRASRFSQIKNRLSATVAVAFAFS